MGTNTDKILATAMVIAYIASFIVGATTLFVGPVADDGTGTVADTTTDETRTTTDATTHSNAEVEYDLQGNETTKGDPVQVDTDYGEFRVHNISSSPDNVTLHAPGVDFNTRWTGSAAAFEVTDAGSDPDSSGQEARFFDVEFDRVGWWNVTAWDDNGTGDTVNDIPVTNAQIFVEPRLDIDVTVDPVQRDFPGNRTVPVRVTATWSDNGTAVDGANISITNSVGHDLVPPANSGTDSDGELSISRNFWRNDRGADDYEVKAVWPNQDNPKRQGTADMTVDPADARVVDTIGLPVTHGFTSNATWDIEFPNNDPLQDRRLLDNDHLVTGNLSFWNVTQLEDGEPVEWLNVSAPGGPHMSSGPNGNITVWNNGLLTIERRWNDTDHTIRVTAERTGNTTLNEYEVEAEFEPQDPDNVNLRVRPDNGIVPGLDLGPTGSEMTASGGDCDPGAQCRPTGSEDETTGTVGDGDDDTLQEVWSGGPKHGLGQYNLTIQGDDETHFPRANNLDISVQGPHVGTAEFVAPKNGTSIDEFNGFVNNGTVVVRNVTPARGDSRLTFEVDWDGQGSGEIATRIRGDDRSGSGDVLTVDTDQVTVGEETDVTFHIEDVNGNPIPEADLDVFWDRNGSTVADLDGNGTQGHGANGDYVVTIWVNNSIGDLVAHSNDTQDRHAYATLEVVPAHDLDVDISPDGDLAGRDTEYTINVTRDGDPFDGGSAVDIWVLNQDEWDDFQDNGTDALPASDSGNLTRDGEGNYTFNWRGESGSYQVYVRTSDKLHDNVGQVPAIMLEPADISWDPEILVSKVDTNVTVSVHLHDPTEDDHDASELNGTLALQTGGSANSGEFANATFWNGSLSTGPITVATDTGETRNLARNVTDGIDVTNGDAHIDNVTAEQPGDIWAYFQDDATGAVYALSSEPLMVQAPDVAITPDLVCVNVATQLTATVTHPVSGDAIPGANLRLTGGGLASAVNATTNANGVARVTVAVPQSNQVNVTVNGDLAASFTPRNCLSIGFDQPEYESGDDVTVTVSQRDSGTQVPGATVLLNGNSMGTTGTDGTLTFSAPSAGDHTVTARLTGYADAQATLTTTTPPTPFTPEVSSLSVEDPGEDGYVTDTTYTVTGTVQNTGDVTGTATVQLMVDGAVVDSAQLSLDSGQSQQVAFQWTTPSSEGDVTVAIAADGSQQSQTVTVEEQGPTVPGFEIVAVLAALGAAAVVYRRD